MSERKYDGDDKAQEKQRPSHRVSFARIDGQDRDGNDVLGRAQEIGQIWPRRGKEGEAILRFDHIPEEMRGRKGGVLFVKALDETGGRDANPQKRGSGRDDGRDR